MSFYQRHAVHVSDGNLPLLVFVHGLACDQNVWNYIAPRFERTHKVVLYDLMGCGRSQINQYNHETYSTLEGHVDDLIALCEGFDAGPVNVVGHSLGGVIALMAARQGPHLFSRLALLNPSACYRNLGNYHGGFEEADIKAVLASIAADLPAWSAHLAPMVLRTVSNASLIDELQGIYCRNDGEILLEQAKMALEVDIRDEIASVKTPTCLFYSQDDIFVSDEAAAYLRDSLPNARSTTLMTTGHYPHLTDPEVVTAALRSCLLAA